MKPTQEQLDSLAAEHGKIFLFPIGSDDGPPTVDECEHIMVLRRPTRIEWEFYERAVMAAATNPKASATAKLAPTKTLALRCVVWPEKDGQDAIYSEYPGAESVLYLQCQQLGEGGGADLAKKYEKTSSTSGPQAS